MATIQNWSDGSAGNTPITAAQLNRIETSIEQAGVLLDSFAGATDDAKLLKAVQTMSAPGAARQPILLGPRTYTFSTALTLYNGFTLIGTPGMSNPEQQKAGTTRTVVKVTTSGVWLNAVGSTDTPNEVWDVTIRNIAFQGTSATQFLGGTANMWCMNLRDLAWTDFKSIIGSQAQKLLITLNLWDGWLSFLNCYNGAIHVGGSDNALFLGCTNIESGTAYNTAGGANGQYHVWFDYLEKSTIGPLYLTAAGPWCGIRVDGPAYNTGGSNLGGPLWITGAKIEGRNAADPCNGNLVRVTGGSLTIRDSWMGYAMKSPASTGHATLDAGIIHQSGGRLILKGITYDRATGVLETLPLVYTSGGSALVGELSVGSKGGIWAGLPRTKAVSPGTIALDATATALP